MLPLRTEWCEGKEENLFSFFSTTIRREVHHEV